MKRQNLVCERLKKFGYISQRRIRLYGEDLQVLSAPIADEIGYSVLAVVVGTGKLKHLRIPLTLTTMLERELEREETAQLVA